MPPSALLWPDFITTFEPSSDQFIPQTEEGFIDEELPTPTLSELLRSRPQDEVNGTIVNDWRAAYSFEQAASRRCGHTTHQTKEPISLPS